MPTRLGEAPDLSDKLYLHFPLEANIDNIGSTDPSLYGICVSKCPDAVGNGLVVTDSSDSSTKTYVCDCLSLDTSSYDCPTGLGIRCPTARAQPSTTPSPP